MSENKENKPLNKVKVGNVTSTIWKNTITPKGKDSFEVLSFNIERSYKDDNDKWANTNSMRKEDIAKIELVLAKTKDFIYSYKQDKENDD